MIQIESNIKSILIVGLPATGKTTFAAKLSEAYPRFKLFHTDDYIKYGFKESVYKLQEDTPAYEQLIIEGVQAYRLLKNGYQCDLIIHCICNKATRLRRRPNIDLQFDKLLINWWKDFLRLGSDTPVIEIDTEESRPFADDYLNQ